MGSDLAMTTPVDEHTQRIDSVVAGSDGRHRAAFTATVAERVVGDFRPFAQRIGYAAPGLVADALDLLWSHLLDSASVPETELRHLATRLEAAYPDALVPADAGPDVLRLSQGAVLAFEAVFYAVNSLLDDDPRNVTWSADAPLNRVSWHLEETSPSADRRAQALLAQIDNSPATQRERQRQLRDLADAAALPTDPAEARAWLTRMRIRSQREAAMLLDDTLLIDDAD